jgi:integrase/recombinase XerD
MTPLRKRMVEQLQLRDLSKATEETYVKCVERYADFFHRSPEQLGPEQVREYLLHLKNDRKVKTNTILVNRSGLRFLYVETLKQKWFDEEVAQPKRRPALPGILSADEVTSILDHTTNLKHWTIIATLYATALRCNELRNLKVGDIDSVRMVLHVREGKGGIAREVPLPPLLLDRLRVYFRWQHPADWLFPSRQCLDQPLDDASIRVLVRTAGRRAGIGRCVHPHLFRHACATHMLDAGADLRTIQVLLGHGDIRTTARYLRVSLQRLQAIRSPFEALNLKPLDASGDDGRQK